MSRILVTGAATLLSPCSGPARALRHMLQVLSVAGWQSRSVTLNGDDAAGSAALLPAWPALDPRHHLGECVTVPDGRVTHQVLVAHDTRPALLRPWEQRAFHALTVAALAEWQPHVVLAWCSATSSLPPQALLDGARRHGARTVLYLDAPGFACGGSEGWSGVDELLVPCPALARHYAESTGLPAHVAGIVQVPAQDGRQALQQARVASRGQRFVTMLDPTPERGGHFFLQLAQRLAVQAPGVRFRAVEGDWGRARWAARGWPEAELARIDWVPAAGRHDGGTRLLDEAALLIEPSLWLQPLRGGELEALRAGVPVITTRTGRLPEILDTHRLQHTAPAAALRARHRAPGPDDVQPWADYVRLLMTGHDELYAHTVLLTLVAAHRHAPDAAEAPLVQAWEAIRATVGAGAVCEAADSATVEAWRRRTNDERGILNTYVRAGRMARGSGPDDTPYQPLIQRSLEQPALQQAQAAARAGDWAYARELLEDWLRLLPEDLAALRLLADTALGQGCEAEARELFERLVTLAPGYAPALLALVTLLQRAGEAQAALEHAFALMENAPQQGPALLLNASVLADAGRLEEAAGVYAAGLGRHPGGAGHWLRYGQVLQALGRPADAAAAFRSAVCLSPGCGAAWLGLAETRPGGLTDDAVGAIQAQLRQPKLPGADRAALHVALGRAFGQQPGRGSPGEHYAEANRTLGREHGFDVARVEEFVAEARALFTAAFLAARLGPEDDTSATDPARVIIVLGVDGAAVQRVEQLLAGHHAVESTRGLPHLERIVRDLAPPGPGAAGRVWVPALQAPLLATLGREEWALLGRQAQALYAAARRSGRTVQVDSAPGLWMLTGLIPLLLPGARLVDARSEPSAAFSALFEQRPASWPTPGGDAPQIARLVSAYEQLMAHFDAVLPGRVHRVQVAQLDGAGAPQETGRLLRHCGLDQPAPCPGRPTPPAPALRASTSVMSARPSARRRPWPGPRR
jgi:tetratricopeptide (TPR) repeat protein